MSTNEPRRGHLNYCHRNSKQFNFNRVVFLVFVSFVFSISSAFASSRDANSSSSLTPEVNSNNGRSYTEGLLTNVLTPQGGEEGGGWSPQEHWTVWDKPGDQLAVENQYDDPSQPSPSIKVKSKRKGKQRMKKPQVPVDEKQVSIVNEQQRQAGGCGGNLQVTIFPVVLVLITAIAGLIAVIIFWFIGGKWAQLGSGLSGGHHNEHSNGYGGGGGEGWGSRTDKSSSSSSLLLQRQLLPAFAKLLKTYDFDQLTKMVSGGLETYKKYAATE